MKRTIIFLALLAALLLLLVPAGAEEAENLTAECTFKTVNGSKTKNIADGKYTTYWTSDKRNEPWVTVSCDKPLYGLYLCFRNMPDSYVIQKADGDGWTTVQEGDTRFYHVWVELDGIKKIRIQSTAENKSVLGFNEIFAFGEGESPDWVQKWEPTEEKADILFLACHPDDDILFMGSPIAWYGVVQQKKVVVAYLTWSNTTRRSEALNGLWTLGIRNYPVFGDLKDHYSNGKTRNAKLKAAYGYVNGGKQAVWEWVSGLYRQYRPEVVVTHDLDGEYGHAQHMMVADAAIQSFEKAADASLYPESAEKYGAWQVKKLYVHLYGDEAERTAFDWDQPCEALGGMTPNEISEIAYAKHVTQASSGQKINGKKVVFSVAEFGVKLFPNNSFGLYSTTVGPDEGRTDFLEHIDGTAAEERTESMAAEADGTASAETEEETGEEDETETNQEEVTAEETGEDVEEEPATESRAAAEPGTAFSVRDKDVTAPEWADVALNGQGFLDEGEYVFADDENGHYMYVNPTLRIQIVRDILQPDKKHPFYRFTAHVWCDTEAGELPTTVFVDPEKPTRVTDFARNIAMNNKAVLAITTDYYIYRIQQPYNTGIEIRNGEIIIDDPRKLQNSMPTYETLALFRDGHAESWANTEKTAEEYINDGAWQVYTFGPCLVKDSQLTDYILKKANTSYNPRMAMGVAEDGHYIIMMCEGRIARSKGLQMPYLAQLMLDEGCTLAVNLDGGQSAVMTFMGHQMNQIVKTDPNGREQADLLTFGTSEQVGTFEMHDEFKTKKKK